ncbi:MAG: DinB family protein [Hyphomicrobiales bacterium]|nr:DinB family protein [Hyphomicrobiales bacterium]
MISPDHVRLFARYNRWQNESLYGAADTLTDAERKADRGAFFGSIHGTLSHLAFGDQIWMYRFTGDDAFRPIAGSIAESVTAVQDWVRLKAVRTDLDERIIGWADRVTPEHLAGDLVWFSGAANKELTRPRWVLVTHMFNHQTHHRGQVHCLLTQYGRKPAATDIPFMPS